MIFRAHLQQKDRELLPKIVSEIHKMVSKDEDNLFMGAAAAAMATDDAEIIIVVESVTFLSPPGGSGVTIQAEIQDLSAGSHTLLEKSQKWDQRNSELKIQVPEVVQNSVYSRHLNKYTLVVTLHSGDCIVRKEIAIQNLLATENSLNWNDAIGESTCAPQPTSVIRHVTDSVNCDVNATFLTAICAKDVEYGELLDQGDLSNFVRKQAASTWKRKRNKRFIRRGIGRLYELSGSRRHDTASGAVRIQPDPCSNDVYYILSARLHGVDVDNFRVVFGVGDNMGMDRDPDFYPSKSSEVAKDLNLNGKNFYFSLDRIAFRVEVKMLITTERKGRSMGIRAPNINANIKMRVSCENVFVAYESICDCVPSHSTVRDGNSDVCNFDDGTEGVCEYKFRQVVNTPDPDCSIRSQDLYCENLHLVPKFIINSFHVEESQIEEFLKSDYLGPIFLQSLVADPHDVNSHLTDYGEDIAHWMYGSEADSETGPHFSTTLSLTSFSITADQRYEIPTLFTALNDIVRSLGMDVVMDEELEELARTAEDEGWGRESA